MPANIHVVGNKVNVPDISRISKHEHSNVLVFIGKMNYDPNVIAVLYFVNKIFPSLCVEFPDLQFIIVGANPDKRIQKLASHDNITVTGYVDSIELFYQKATIVVAPMLTGAGIQNKIIQAMSYGCCVMTTSIGAEGLNIRNNEIAIFDEDQQMKDGILFLLNNPELRRKMGINARQYVIDYLSNDIIADQFWTFMNDPLNK
jgi:glycosyltransferase, family 1